VLALLGLGTFNLLIDPYDAYRLAFRDRLLPYKDAWYTRTAKAEMLSHGGWKAVVIGNSRVELGIDPDSPALVQPAYNAGLPGASAEEILLAGRLALQDPQLRRLIVCIHLRDFLGSPNEDEYRDTRLNPDLDLLSYHLDHLIGLEATGKSFATLANARKDKPSRAHRRGLVEHPDAATSPRSWQLTEYSDNSSIDTLAYTGPLEPSRVQPLKDLLALAARRDVKLDLVILPTHAVAIARLDLNGQWPALERFLAELASIVAVHNASFPSHPVSFWDFTSFDGASAEPYPTKEQPHREMTWWYDSGHFRPVLGEQVLRCINATGDQSIGIRITPEELPVHLSRLRAGRDAFLATHLPR
jgi:hypothetical protein